MELFSILNELEELAADSPKIPLTGKVMVNEDRLLDCLDRIRATLPEEIRQAKWVLQEREKMLAESKKEAMRIMEDSQKQLDRRAEESEVVRQARIMADEVVQRAEQVAREIKQGARDYADDVLCGVEGELDKLIAQVKNGRAELKGLKTTE